MILRLPVGGYFTRSLFYLGNGEHSRFEAVQVHQIAARPHSGVRFREPLPLWRAGKSRKHYGKDYSRAV